MSIALMTRVFYMDTIKPFEKLVLLALADAANDDGYTYIPVKRRERGFTSSGLPKLDIMHKTGMPLRTIQRSLRVLEEAGFLTREENPGKGMHNFLHLPEGCHRGTGAREARGGATVAPKPSVTIKEWEIPPAKVNADVWIDFLTTRKNKGSPLATKTAHSRLCAKLKTLSSKGYDANELVSEAVEHGWLTVYEPKPARNNKTGKGDGTGTHDQSNGHSSPMVRAAIARGGGGGSGGDAPGHPDERYAVDIEGRSLRPHSGHDLF